MAITEQCENCGRSLSECPYYNKDSVELCQNYVQPIDNSGFFAHFFSPKGRIGRVQYLVTVLIAVAFYVLMVYVIGDFLSKAFGQKEMVVSIITIASFILAAALITVAGLKRCHDGGVDWWYAIMPIALLFVGGLVVWIIGAAAGFFLFFQKSEVGLNEHGSEPLKPYLPQVGWHQE